MEFLRPRRPSPGIDLAPLIDCVFLLLIFFMLSSSFLQPAIPLQLPSSTSKETPDPNRIVISVDANDTVFVNDEPVAIEQLGSTLLRLSNGETTQPVLFRGDQSIRYDRFIAVVTETRKAGFRHLSLQHQPAAPATP
ncbi:MAG TPA: biopolymer transporter ExbD [Kiritimatiellia bacterium]|nr:biopolymer transporter ExbD [Kiritimatiellia bacterium]HMP33830.1 biopolymer transporter ExbD [Kiritimatiellia bacterium]